MKRIKYVLALFIAAVMIFAVGCSAKIELHDVSEYRKILDYKDGFKVMMLTDIHISRLSNLEEISKYLTHNINEAQPDLIVLNGDNFFDASKASVDYLFNFIDSFKISWVYLQGNHDHQGTFDPTYPDEVVSRMKYSLNVDYPNDGIDGTQNFYVDLMDGNDLVYRLFMIDGGSYARLNPVKYTYEQIKESQLAHIEKIQSQEEDDSYTSLAFFHSPLQEYEDAYKGYTEGKYEGKGENREGNYPSLFSSNQYERLKGAGIRGVFCGHDHVNNSIIDYDGFICGYGVKATREIYHDEDIMGYLLITLTDDAFSIDNCTSVYVDYDSVVEGK